MLVEAHWILFFLASIAVIATPGQDMLLVMSRAITHGTSAGLATAAGVSVGLLGHTILATAGLGAVLKASEWLFTVLKIVGASYLVYLGVQLLRAQASDFVMASSAPQTLGRHFRTGVFSNVANPKIAVFYFAFLPQFVSADARSPVLTIGILGLIFAALTFVIKGPVALSAGALSTWFRTKPKGLVWLYRCSGLMMLGLAVRLALSKRDV